MNGKYIFWWHFTLRNSGRAREGKCWLKLQIKSVNWEFWKFFFFVVIVNGMLSTAFFTIVTNGIYYPIFVWVESYGCCGYKPLTAEISSFAMIRHCFSRRWHSTRKKPSFSLSHFMPANATNISTPLPSETTKTDKEIRKDILKDRESAQFKCLFGIGYRTNPHTNDKRFFLFVVVFVVVTERNIGLIKTDFIHSKTWKSHFPTTTSNSIFFWLMCFK